MRARITTLKLSPIDEALVAIVRRHAIASSDAEAIRCALRTYLSAHRVREDARFAEDVAELDRLVDERARR